MNEIILDISPVAKPRMTRRDRWKKRKCVVKYWHFKDKLKQIVPKDIDYNLIDIVFYIEMPKSWSKKKKEKMNGTYHQQKPDTDNLLKGFYDALFDDDAHIYRMCGTKVWSHNGYIKLC